MDWIVIDGVRPWDGRYEFDLDGQPLTTREWGLIKRLAGYMPFTVEQGLEGGDPELVTAWAVIAMRRAGKVQPDEVTSVFERLADAPFGGTITFEGGIRADDAGPPPPSSNGNSSSSGPGSTTSSEISPVPASGIQGSDTSVSGPAMWGN